MCLSDLKLSIKNIETKDISPANSRSLLHPLNRFVPLLRIMPGINVSVLELAEPAKRAGGVAVARAVNEHGGEDLDDSNGIKGTKRAKVGEDSEISWNVGEVLWCENRKE